MSNFFIARELTFTSVTVLMILKRTLLYYIAIDPHFPSPGEKKAKPYTALIFLSLTLKVFTESFILYLHPNCTWKKISSFFHEKLLNKSWDEVKLRTLKYYATLWSLLSVG